MTGILLGVLLARTVAGLIAELGVWRAVYWSVAGPMAATGVVLSRRLEPETVPRHHGYRSLMASVATLARREPFLQVRAAYGALTFAAFSVLWSTLGRGNRRRPAL
jgi:MFS family permease